MNRKDTERGGGAEKKPVNYHRFYGLLRGLRASDPEGLKESLVESFTEGRTTHLHEMTGAEYSAMCASIEARTGWTEKRRKARSLCLKLMQQCGVDTTDWDKVNAFCRSGRIAGKEFARLDIGELGSLQVKLRSILRRGGLKPRVDPIVSFSLPVKAEA